MGRRPSTQSCATLMDTYINTSYDTVKLVADNLEAILETAENIPNTLKYLGAHASNPTLRLDGSPIVNGDYYFNAVNDSLVYYDQAATSWFVVNPSDVVDAREEAVLAAAEALVSEANAKASELVAIEEANIATTKASEASVSATEAKASEVSAGDSATLASDSETVVIAKAGEADASAIAASGSASAASVSESNAEASAVAALVSENNALFQADRAEQYADSVANSIIFRGDWDASTGLFPTPTLLPVEKVDVYNITVAGTLSDGNQPDVTVKVSDQLNWHPDTNVWYKLGGSSGGGGGSRPVVQVVGNFNAEPEITYIVSTADITLPGLIVGETFEFHAVTDNVRVLNPSYTISNGTRSIIAGDNLLMRNGQTVTMSAISLTELEVR